MNNIIPVREMAEKKLDDCAKIIKDLPYKIRMNIIMVDPQKSSKIYVNNKIKKVEKAGAESNTITYDKDITTDQLADVIHNIQCEFIKESNVYNGLMVQLPLPDHIDEKAILDEVDKCYDVDALSTEHSIDLNNGNPLILPCTVQGIMDIIYDKCDRDKRDIRDYKIAVVGRGTTVGRPLVTHLVNLGATVLSCNSRTKNLDITVSDCDIIISAAGKYKVFGDMYKIIESCKEKYPWTGIMQLLIDVGINTDENNKLCGDICHNEHDSQFYEYTKSPGGVGQMTTTNVVYNLIKLSKLYSSPWFKFNNVKQED